MFSALGHFYLQTFTADNDFVILLLEATEVAKEFLL